jgi:hypothetical protein
MLKQIYYFIHTKEKNNDSLDVFCIEKALRIGRDHLAS